MEVRANANLWLPIAFAAVVSEATPMSSLRHLPESLQQMSSKLMALNMPPGIAEHSISGVIELTIAYFPVVQVLVVVSAFGFWMKGPRDSV